MANSDYIDHTDDGLAKQMVTFRDNIARELAALGLLATDPDIVQQALDATRFRAVDTAPLQRTMPPRRGLKMFKFWFLQICRAYGAGRAVAAAPP